MKTIPTAEEFLKQKPFINGMTRGDQVVAMIEFAKLHVKAALEVAYNNQRIEQHKKEDMYDYPNSSHFRATKDSIIFAYPEENIK